jgi:opacity protein-like surface antigen
MIKTRILLLAGLGLGGLLAPAAAAQTFVRAAAWWVDYDAPYFDSSTGVGAEAGRFFGAGGQQVASLEIARLSWNYAASFAGPAPGVQLGTFGHGRLTPLLATYRYHFGSGRARWQAHVGVSVGATRVTGRFDTSFSGLPPQAGELDNWTATLAGSLGVAFRVWENLFVDLGYRYLRLEDVNVTMHTATFPGGGFVAAGAERSFAATKAHAGTLGLSIRF